MKLEGATCVLTGGARGLGAGLARELVSRGGRVLISDIDCTELQDLGIELDSPTMHCNVTDREQVEALGRAAMEEWGTIDLWINNAGIWLANASVEDTDFNQAQRLLDVNYFGMAYGMAEAVKHMRGKNSGVILNTLSVRSLKARALGGPYAASKFAAEGFTQAVREELRDTGIKVVGLYPYRMKTELFKGVTYKDYDSYMDPAEVAKIILDNIEEPEPAERVEVWALDDVRITKTV